MVKNIRMNKDKEKQNRVKAFNDSIVYGIGRLYVLLDYYFSKNLKKFGLNPPKFNLLMLIKHIGKERGISQTQLGNNLFVSAANITKLIDGLERKGLVRRIPSPKDRRVNLIKITREGSTLLDEVWPGYVTALNSILEGFSLKDKEKFNRYLEYFKKEIEKKVADE